MRLVYLLQCLRIVGERLVLASILVHSVSCTTDSRVTTLCRRHTENAEPQERGCHRTGTVRETWELLTTESDFFAPPYLSAVDFMQIGGNACLCKETLYVPMEGKPG